MLPLVKVAHHRIYSLLIEVCILTIYFQYTCNTTIRMMTLEGIMNQYNYYHIH